ncbi:MAG: hypothetical protein AB7V43_01090 [Acidimicrobiia bacterium]
MNLAVLRSRERNLQRGLGALAGLAFLVVAIPALLLRLSRTLLDSPNPLVGLTAPWSWSCADIRHALTRAVDNETVIATIGRVGLAAAWSALVIVVVSVAFEVRFLRVQGIGMPRLHGFGWSQAIAQRLAGGLLALSTMVPSHVSSAAPLPPRAVATVPIVAAPLSRTGNQAAPTPTQTEQWTTHTIWRGDSIYGIAGRIADGDRGRTRQIAQQILDRNLGRVMTDGRKFTTPGVVGIGWILDIPTDREVPVVAAPVSAAPVAPATATEETHTVQRGDSYWEIADDHLEIVLGHEPTPREVFDETRDLMEANVERLGRRTPNSMLYRGDILVLPNPNGHHPPVETPQEPPPRPTSTIPPPTATAPVVAPTTPHAAPANTESTPSAPESPGPTSPLTSTPTPATDGETPDVSEATTPNPWTKLVIGSLFATGIAATVTRLRRRRLARRRPGHRLESATPAAATTETILHGEARPDRIAALHELLGSLTGHTRLEGNKPLVRAVQLNDTGVELLWSEAQSSPPKSWTTTDGGWSWRTPWPPERRDHRQRRPILPTLVPIGVRADGGELLLDLETAGSLSIDGTPELVAAFTHQLVLALGASPLADNIDLITVDVVVPGAKHLERIRSSSLDTALKWLATRTTETRAALAKTKAHTTFAARMLGRSNDEWEPIVVVATSVDSPAADEFADAAPSGSGSVAVGRGVVTAIERIVLHDDQHAEWVSLGLVFTPHLVTPAAGADIAELLANVEDTVEVEAILDESPIQPEETPADSEGGSELRHGCFDVLVRVLGEVEVEGCAEHLTEAEVELLALLATVRHDGPINLDRLATLLAHDEWRTPKPRSIQARISHLRRKLGNGTDGAPLLPDSRAATGNPSRYLISSRVVTDIDLLDHAYRLADDLPSSEAVSVLRHAFELVRGKPYTAQSGFTWAYDEHAAARAEQVVGDVAARLIDLYGEAGDAAGIQWVIQRARRGLDGPIAELPHRIIERTWAARMTDPTLVESTADYERELAAAIEDDDPNGDYDLRKVQST